MPRDISVEELKRLRESGERHALFDVRERGEYNRKQLPNATPLPRGLLELRAPVLMPVRDIPAVVLCDDGRRSALAAETLAAMGYRDVRVVTGGLDAWEAAGYPIQEGVGVPGKDYGEMISVVKAIPQITPEELVERQRADEKFVIMDSRTVDEYRRAHLPGAYSVPGGELPATVGDLVPDDQMTIVVNCAGRTRSILGADILMRLGLPNRIYAFKNGTMAWDMAGFELERGEGRGRPTPSAQGRERAERFAAQIAEREGLPATSVAELQRLPRSGELYYVVDVRLPEEYERGHIPGAVSAPGGQLVLTSEDTIAVPDATIVLTCDARARATVGALLYKEMGFPNVSFLDGGTAAWVAAGLPLETGRPLPEIAGLDAARAQTRTLQPAELKAKLDGGAGVAIVDVRGSGDYALGHVAGSSWIPRGRLELRVGEVVPDRSTPVVTVCDSGIRSTLAAGTLRAHGYEDVAVLDGGIDAWRAAGLPLEEGLRGADVTIDHAKGDIESFRRAGVLERNRQDMEYYLSWEEALGHKYESSGAGGHG
ncbi:MAG: sulfurtransferase [Chloroflexi bacterium]|nr:sulfurtransferase [Chloroflexota bacterium]